MKQFTESHIRWTVELLADSINGRALALMLQCCFRLSPVCNVCIVGGHMARPTAKLNIDSLKGLRKSHIGNRLVSK